MKHLSEETLNAYADGALEAGARAEVEAQLAADAEARALLKRLRAADRLASEAFAAPMREPPPQALVDAILRAPAADPAGRGRDAAPGRRPRQAWSARRYAVPLAASVAFAVGLAGGALLGPRLAEPAGELALGEVPGDSVLFRLLERHSSGSVLEAGGRKASARRVGVVATFMDRHARPCREVEVLAPGTDPHPIAAGVACRGAGGRWLMEGATRLAGPTPAAGSEFQPSGVPQKDALDGLLTLLGAQRALDHSEEKALMERGWKR
jgi:hypothetical protein